MGSFSIWHWLIVLVVVLILFGGRGKISQLMGDFGKGLRSFKKSMREDEPFDEQPSASVPPPQIPADAVRVGEAGPSRPAAAGAAAAAAREGEKSAPR
jgi:sec-independent protein translocase protein TatA